MRFALASGLALVAFTLAEVAHAQEFAQNLCAEVSSTDRTINPRALRSAALDGVRYETLDYNDDGTVTSDEIFRALTDDASNFCTQKTDTTEGRVLACSDGQDNALRIANSRLKGFWLQKGAIFDVTGGANPSATDFAQRPGLGARPWAPLLDDQARYGKAVCRPGEEQVAIDESEKGGPAFLLGKDIDSLTVSREGDGRDRLAKVTPAEVSFVSDNAADTRTFAIDAVAGLRLVDRSRFKFTPFVQYSRSEVRDRAAGTSTLSGKFAAGAVATFIPGWDQIDFAPLYTRSLENHAELLTGRIAWRPGFLYRLDGFNDATHFACKRTAIGACEIGNGLALWTDFQMVSSLGTVLDEGTDPAFINGKNYWRMGPSAALHLYGLSGIVEDMSFDVSYKRLFRISGDRRRVYAFKADLSYWIAGSENVSVTGGYERSRDEETLELTDEWKIALGVRF